MDIEAEVNAPYLLSLGSLVPFGSWISELWMRFSGSLYNWRNGRPKATSWPLSSRMTSIINGTPMIPRLSFVWQMTVKRARSSTEWQIGFMKVVKDEPIFFSWKILFFYLIGFCLPEEIFSSNKALWFSPDGMKLVYASFNDSMVKKFNFIEYGGLSPTSLYPTTNSVRYPKASRNLKNAMRIQTWIGILGMFQTGTENPQVQLHLVELDSVKTIQLPPPESIRGR